MPQPQARAVVGTEGENTKIDKGPEAWSFLEKPGSVSL